MNIIGFCQKCSFAKIKNLGICLKARGLILDILDISTKTEFTKLILKQVLGGDDYPGVQIIFENAFW